MKRQLLVKTIRWSQRSRGSTIRMSEVNRDIAGRQSSDDEVEMAADDEGTDQQHEMADHLSGGSSEDGGEDPNHEMNSDRGTNTSDESAGEDVMNEDRANSVPSGDDTPEDPMEHVFDPTFNGEKKIYAGSSVTMAALLLLLMAFILKHGLSKAATKHLLELLNFVVPGCVPKSVWYLEKYFLDYNDKTEIHFYCPRCANYLGVEPGNECGVCQQTADCAALHLVTLPTHHHQHHLFQS
ncbi:uncharacterized protein LOC117480527 [Trematomus bernacchii]|uniref:uncharacterized protein LOC117480527 n=1 Tax=Trematomus bernacchii TaxID=40690 RepID=UPI00146C0A0A|nr:uncharacterized protein LOC117480527 [Trematomus bernacchii]